MDIINLYESSIVLNMLDEGRLFLTEVSHSKAMAYMRKILDNMKTDIVQVVFQKTDGSERTMKVHFDKDFVRKHVRGDKSERIINIKATNRAHDNIVVCELLPSGNYQFRTIPCRRIKKVNIV